jgi:RNA polymerase sigma-70 factor (ECF subfamily)
MTEQKSPQTNLQKNLQQNLQESLAGRFEAQRAHLRAVAYRMLGSQSEADDAVQETWLRLSRSDADGVENLGGWLTTVVARVCLDVLRSRKSRREEPLGPDVPEPVSGSEGGFEPERDELLAESVGLALLVVLQTLAPAERVAFVLHDMFDLPFDEIAPIVGRSSTATRQLASRARRRVQGVPPASDASRDIVRDAGRPRQREVVEAFLAASRGGDFEALLNVLDPNIVVRADSAAMSLGSPAEIHGAAAVARAFLGKAQRARPALVNGAMGIAVATAPGRLLVVLRLTIIQGRIVEIDAVADAESMRQLDLVMIED